LGAYSVLFAFSGVVRDEIRSNSLIFDAIDSELYTNLNIRKIMLLQSVVIFMLVSYIVAFVE
jgi:hypothetical protein